MSSTSVRPLTRTLTTLTQAAEIAAIGGGERFYYFQFAPGQPRRKHWVDKDGWVLIAAGDSAISTAYNFNDTYQLDPNFAQKVQTFTGAPQISAMADLGRIRIDTPSKTLSIESSNPTVIARVKAYKPPMLAIGEESMFANNGSQTFVAGTIAPTQLINAFVLSGKLNGVTASWGPTANFETGLGDTRVRMWVRSPIVLLPTPLKALRVTPFAALDYSTLTGGGLSQAAGTPATGKEDIYEGILFEDLPTAYTATYNVKISNGKPMYVKLDQLTDGNHLAFSLRCTAGQIIMSIGTGPNSSPLNNTTVYTDNAVAADVCDSALTIELVKSGNTFTLKSSNNNASVSYTLAAGLSPNNIWSGRHVLFFDRTAGFSLLNSVSVRTAEVDKTSGLNITQGDKNTTVSGIVLPVDSGYKVADVYSIYGSLEANGTGTVVLGEQPTYTILYSQKPTTLTQLQINESGDVTAIKALSDTTFDGGTWSRARLARIPFTAKLKSIKIPFPPSMLAGTVIRVRLASSQASSILVNQTEYDFGNFSPLTPGGTLDLTTQCAAANITLVTGKRYWLAVQLDRTTRMYPSVGYRQTQFDSPTPTWTSAPPWAIPVNQGNDFGAIGGEVIIEY